MGKENLKAASDCVALLLLLVTSCKTVERPLTEPARKTATKAVEPSSSKSAPSSFEKPSLPPVHTAAGPEADDPVLDKKPMIIFAIGARNKTNNKAAIILEVGRDCNIDTGELLCDWSDRTISLPVDLLQEITVPCFDIGGGDEPSSTIIHKIRQIGDIAIAAPDFFSSNSLGIDPLQYIVVSFMVWDYVNTCNNYGDVSCNNLNYIESRCIHIDPTDNGGGNFIESRNRESPRIYTFRYLFNENTLSSPQVISFSDDHIPFYAANEKHYDFGGIGLDLHNCKYESSSLLCKVFFNIVDTWRGYEECSNGVCQQYFYYFGGIVFDTTSTAFSNLPTDETTYTSNRYIDGQTSYTQGSAAVIIPYLEENNYSTCHNQRDDDFDGFIDMEDADCIEWANRSGYDVVDIRGRENKHYDSFYYFTNPSAHNGSDAVCGDDNLSISIMIVKKGCTPQTDYCSQFNDNKTACDEAPECDPYTVDNGISCLPSGLCLSLSADKDSCESYEGCQWWTLVKGDYGSSIDGYLCTFNASEDYRDCLLYTSPSPRD